MKEGEMTTREASAIVVKMAQDRDKDSSEGMALRIVLRELRERREFEIEAEPMVAAANEKLERILEEIQQ